MKVKQITVCSVCEEKRVWGVCVCVCVCGGGCVCVGGGAEIIII